MMMMVVLSGKSEKHETKIRITFEPPHDKTNKMTVRPAKSQISLDIRQVWSDSSLCAQWVAKDPSFLHADSEDSDQTGRMPRLIRVFAGHTCHFVGFVKRQLIFFKQLLVLHGLEGTQHLDTPLPCHYRAGTIRLSTNTICIAIGAVRYDTYHNISMQWYSSTQKRNSCSY